MERFVPLLLAAWREACRHIEISEAVARIAPILVKRLPADLILVRALDPSRRCIETVGVGNPGR